MRRATLIQTVELDEPMHARSGTHLGAEISQDQVLNDLGVTQVLSACIIQFTEVVLHSVLWPLLLEKEIVALLERYKYFGEG